MSKPAAKAGKIAEYAAIASAVVVIGLLAARITGVFADPGPPPLLVAEPSATATVEAQAGETIRASFTIRNASDAPVQIIGAPSTCGCTAVEVDFPLTLAAGESTVIQIEMTVGEYDDTGRFASQTTLLVDRAGAVPVLTTQAVLPLVTQGGPPMSNRLLTALCVLCFSGAGLALAPAASGQTAGIPYDHTRGPSDCTGDCTVNDLGNGQKSCSAGTCNANLCSCTLTITNKCPCDQGGTSL